MDRTLPHFIGLSLALLAGSVCAEEQPGLAQYQAAMISQAQLATLTKDILSVSDAEVQQRSPEATAQLRDQLVARATTFADQLQASAEQGFAPAQYTYALTLRSQAFMSKDPTRSAALKTQACDLTNKAAASGLLAAALARSFFCTGASLTTDPIAVRAAADKAREDLAAALDRADPYAAYYPLKASVKEDCFEWPTEPGEQSALQRIQAAQPRLLSLEQTRTEAVYHLAVREFDHHKVEARQHLAQAKELGCAGEAPDRLTWLLRPDAKP